MEVLNKNSLKHYAELGQIYALQLISEYCRGDKNSYYGDNLPLRQINERRLC